MPPRGRRHGASGSRKRERRRQFYFRATEGAESSDLTVKNKSIPGRFAFVVRKSTQEAGNNYAFDDAEDFANRFGEVERLLIQVSVGGDDVASPASAAALQLFHDADAGG